MRAIAHWSLRSARNTAVAAGVVAGLLLVAPAGAQTSIDASLSGTITDPSGAVVPAADLELKNIETNAVFRVASDGAGFYHFPRIPRGVYALTVQKDRFRTLVRDGLIIGVNQAAVVNLQLTVGEVGSAITVKADAGLLQTQSANFSMLVDEARIRDLPLNGKDFQKLYFLAPGVGGQRGNNSSTNNSSSGARDAANNYVIDGLSGNDERQTAGLAPGNSGQLAPNVISTEAIQEFRVITSNADATFGRGSGAQINIVTKSGTNNLHGSAYEYLRNSALDARDFFNYGPFLDSEGRAKTPPFRQNLFGASIGGPLRRDQHFFFGNYEGFQQRLQETSSPILPNADLVRLIPGDLGRLSRAFYFDQGIVPSSGNPPGEFRALPSNERSAAQAAGFPATLFDGLLANGEAGTVVVSRSSTRDFDQDCFLLRAPITSSATG